MIEIQNQLSVNPENGNSTKPMLGAVPVHKFPYNWNLKDAVFTKDKGKYLVVLLVVVALLWVTNLLDLMY